MHIAAACITDLRSLRAAARIIRKQNPRAQRITLPTTLHDKLVNELAAELNWSYSPDTLRWCMTVEGLWVEPDTKPYLRE